MKLRKQLGKFDSRRAWMTIWDKVKMPRCRHKVMHRKRVTSELHDSYFRSMRIKHAIPKTEEVHISMASYGKRSRRRAWLTIWDKVKIPRCRHKVMHRKRVTCELPDSYFHLMTIKHAIPRTAEVIHSYGQLWGDIEWAIELSYNSVKTGSQLVFGDQIRW